MLSYCYNMMNRLRIAEGSKILIPNTDSFFFKEHYKHYIKYKNKNLLTVTMESKTKTTLFAIGYKKSNLQKNYIKI